MLKEEGGAPPRNSSPSMATTSAKRSTADLDVLLAEC